MYVGRVVGQAMTYHMDVRKIVNWHREDHHEECCREQRQEGLPGARGEVSANYLRGLRLGQSRQIGRQKYSS